MPSPVGISGKMRVMTAVNDQVAKWTQWIEGPVRNDVIGMHHNRHIWRELTDLLKANPAVADTPSAFWEWMKDNYVSAQAVAIRRQADRDPRVTSLARLIEEMRDDAPRLTRAYFVGLWDDEDGYWTAQANAAFDALAGEVGDHLDPEVPRADLARLRSDASTMKRYVDEHIAHRMDEPTMTELPTFNDLDAAVEQSDRCSRSTRTR